MTITLEAVYENGVFRPLRSVELPDQKRVTITIDTAATGPEIRKEAGFVLSPAQWQSFCEALGAPPWIIPALRQLLTEPSAFDDSGTKAS